MEFNDFIDAIRLEDPPFMGRKFTWYRQNGQAKSRPDTAQYVLKRDVSDHFPLVLKSVNVNWGSKTFKSRNCWLMDPSFLELVQNMWSSLDIQGWVAFVFKEKLKILKQKIKQWNKDNLGT